MAGHGRGSVCGEHAAGAEGGRGDLPGVLRGAGGAVSAGGAGDNPGVHRKRSKYGQEAGDGTTVATIGRAHIGAGWEEIKEFIGSAGKGLRADRERALLCVAYETLARRGELVALEVRDIEFWPNGTGQALIRRGKTDAEGQGRVAYLSRETVKWVKIWLEHANISKGAVFRRLIGADQIGDALHPGSIAPIFKRVAQWIGMPARFVAEEWAFDQSGCRTGSRGARH
jgi:integrase